jgi:hypothetical protein
LYLGLILPLVLFFSFFLKSFCLISEWAGNAKRKTQNKTQNAKRKTKRKTQNAEWEKPPKRQKNKPRNGSRLVSVLLPFLLRLVALRLILSTSFSLLKSPVSHAPLLARSSDRSLAASLAFQRGLDSAFPFAMD